MAKHIVSEGHYEMLWDCEFCDTKGLLAKSQRYCAECGGPQNPDKRYFPEEGAEKRVDGHKYEGADRHCPACNTPQAAAGHNCTHCGAPLDGAKQVRGIAAAPVTAPPKKRRWWIVALVVGVLAVIALIAWWRLRTKSAEMTVTAHRWTRAIAIEEYADVDEGAWRDQVPGDARGVACHRKERSTRQVDTGEQRCRTVKKDNGDGTFEKQQHCDPVMRSEPVHDDWCRYTVRRWQQLEPVRATGTGLSPAWPTAGLPPDNAAAVLGAKRQGTRTETFTLVLGAQSCDVSEATWRKYRDGQPAKVEVRVASGDVVCSSL